MRSRPFTAPKTSKQQRHLIWLFRNRWYLNSVRAGWRPRAHSSLTRTNTNEFFAGKTNALKVQFFTQPIVEEAQAKLLKHDNREVSRGGYAALVLFLDERDQVWQANLTYVIPGTTVVRTVASSRDELTKYFSDYHFDRRRLRLKSRGTYNTAPDSKDDGLTLSWDTNLDIRVFDQIKK